MFPDISIFMLDFIHYRIEIEKEVRVHVDELMREELKNLKLVMIFDRLILTSITV